MTLRSDSEELQAGETKEALIALVGNYDMMATELERGVGFGTGSPKGIKLRRHTPTKQAEKN